MWGGCRRHLSPSSILDDKKKDLSTTHQKEKQIRASRKFSFESPPSICAPLFKP